MDKFLTAARSAVQDLLDEYAGGDRLREGVYLADLAEDLADYAGSCVRIAKHRDEDLTWQQVGDAFGVSRQAAQQRYGA
jgi:hypothetical protein